MQELFDINKRNQGLILSYIMILTIVLFSYFFMVTLRAQGYNPDLYEKGYMYFMTFAFILFSLVISCWEIRQGYLEMFWDAIMLTVSIIPLVLSIFMIGRLNAVNVLLPLLIQVIWGMVILCVRNMLEVTNLHQAWRNYLIALFIFVIVLLSLVYLYLHVQYEQIVFTTVFDKDIYFLFYLNPLLTIIGLVYKQMGGTTQMGYNPVFYYLISWSLIIVIMCFLQKKLINAKRCKV